MQYHPDLGWLKSHGNDPRLSKKVHIPSAKTLLSRRQMIKHPAVILHELANAYHDQYLGSDDPRVIKAYKKAKAAGMYEKVLLYNTTARKFAIKTPAFGFTRIYYGKAQEKTPKFEIVFGR